MSDTERGDERAASGTEASSHTAFADLKPKGACWYCNEPLDNVRRFCSKVCADDYRLEEESFNPPAL